MRFSRLVPLAVVVLGAAACADSPTAPFADPAGPLAPSFELVPGAPMLLATTGSPGSDAEAMLVELDPATGLKIRDIGPVGYVVDGLEYDPTTGKLYGSTWSGGAYNGLIEIDIDTGAGTPIGVDDWGLPDYYRVDNITVDGTGQMYGWWGFYPQQLVSIDKTTGIATPIGSPFPTGIVEMNGLAFTADGSLWNINGEPDNGLVGDIYRVDPATGVHTLTGDIETLARHGDVDPVSDLYYGIGGDKNGLARDLMKVNLATATVVAVLPDLPNNINALTFMGAPVPNEAPVVGKISIPGDPVALLDQPISVNAAFTDPDGGSHTCTIDYGDGGAPEAGAVVGNTCQGSHTYAEIGLYRVAVTVTDDHGDSGTARAGRRIVIYDPKAGFVTGLGTIDSPAGAMVGKPRKEGPALFAFTSRYRRGNSTPSGLITFTFKKGDFIFTSTSYDWLLVKNGKNARFKGEGRLNGRLAPDGSPYRFKVWAKDGRPDKFRIRIWEKGGKTVYDNGEKQGLRNGLVEVLGG